MVTMKFAMTDCDPVFVHSLWRSGSTYVFSKFRTLPDFYCYQEPVHETLLFAVHEPAKLLLESDFSVNFNHPKLTQPYFFESFEQHGHWNSIISKEMIYDEYFSQVASPTLTQFYSALIAAAPRRVMVQDCRTSCRVGAIKQAVGGIHVHLWRKPWGQWWSFLKDRYFALVIILILNARNAPPVLCALRHDLGLPEFHSDDLQAEFDFFDEFQRSARDHYKVFFAIWCLAFLEGRRYSDIDIEIDRLSKDVIYREGIVKQFSQFDVLSLDFDDCRLDDPHFSQSDREFYREVEEEVFLLIAKNDASVDDIAMLQQAAAVQVDPDEAKVSYVAGLRETGRTIIDIGSARVGRLQRELQRHTVRYDHDMAAARAGAQANLDLERQVTRAIQAQFTAAEATRDTQELELRRALADVSGELVDAKSSLASTIREAHSDAIRSSEYHHAELASLYAQLLSEKEEKLVQLRDRQVSEAELRMELRAQDATLAALKLEMAEQAAAEAALVQREEGHRQAIVLLDEQLKAIRAAHVLQKDKAARTIGELEMEIAKSRAWHAKELEELQAEIASLNAITAEAKQEKATAVSELDVARQTFATEQMASDAKFEAERSSFQQKLDELTAKCRILDGELQATLQTLDRVVQSRLPGFIKRRILKSDLPQKDRGNISPVSCELDVGGIDYVGCLTSGRGNAMALMENNAVMLGSLPELLTLDDAPFVHAAYAKLLGREPDAEGAAHYLVLLRSGGRKIDVLKRLRNSSEGQAYDAAIPGLDKAVRWAVWARFPLIGIIARWAKKVEGDSPAERRMRIINNNVAILRQDVARVSTAMQKDVMELHAMSRRDIGDIGTFMRKGFTDLGQQAQKDATEVRSMVRDIQRELNLVASAQAELASSSQAFQVSALAAIAPIEHPSRVPSARTDAHGPSAPGIMERFFADTVWKV